VVSEVLVETDTELVCDTEALPLTVPEADMEPVPDAGRHCPHARTGGG